MPNSQAKTKLKRVRLFRGLSQSEVAEASGYAVNAYSNLEQGIKPIDNAAAWRVLAICDKLQCEPSDILETQEAIKYYNSLKVRIVAEAMRHMPIPAFEKA